MKNIILVGMPACGKSITGVVLAKTVRKNFVDTDLLIQEHENRPLQEIINESGLEYFKEVEEHVLLQLDADNTVVSTGGSAVYYKNAMEHLKKHGIIVYLKVSLKTVEKRLNNIKTRGVAMSKADTIEQLYERRIPLYEKYANVVIEADDLEVEQTVEKIIKAIS